MGASASIETDEVERSYFLVRKSIETEHSTSSPSCGQAARKVTDEVDRRRFPNCSGGNITGFHLIRHGLRRATFPSRGRLLRHYFLLSFNVP